MAYGDDLFEEIAKLYPELAQKSLVDYFLIDPGWENIVKCLCHTIYGRVDQAQKDLRCVELRKSSKIIIAEKTAELTSAIEELPVIVQVKEKFGTLRFHTTGSTPEMLSAIRLAQSLSGCTCEVCGAPGERESDTWIRTLCNNHKSKEGLPDIAQGKIKPNLFTD